MARIRLEWRWLSDQHIRCIGVLVTEIFEKNWVASMRTHSRSKETQLSSGLISIGSELFSLNLNSLEPNDHSRFVI